MREIAVTHDSENVPKDTREEHEFTKLLKEETVAHAVDVARSSDGFDKSVNHSRQENTPIHMVIYFSQYKLNILHGRNRDA